jgi:hypothetical protein
MLSQVFHALEAFQVGIGLSRLYAETESELTDECHCEADDVSFFSCHNRTILRLTSAKIGTIIEISKSFGRNLHLLTQKGHKSASPFCALKEMNK